MPKVPLILLVNPWITDFAAHDLWTKPMGLLILGSLLRNGGYGVELIDCLDRHDDFTNNHPLVLRGRDKEFGTGKYPRMRIPRPAPYSDFPRYYYRHGIHPDSFRRNIRSTSKPDYIWVTSSMTYWYPGVRETIRVLREELPGIPVWLGGIYALLCPEHAAKEMNVDLVFNGNLPELPNLLYTLSGFSLKNQQDWMDFSLWPTPALDLMPGSDYAPVLTSIGCPFRCPYCASSRLQPVRKRLGKERIVRDVIHAHEVFGIYDFAFYDDALLLDAEETLMPALEELIGRKMSIRFHAPNALHVKALSRKWCDLLYAAGFQTIRLGLETTVDRKNRAWGGKVNTALYLRNLENLFAAGFEGSRIGVYLLCGVPGQHPEEIARAIELVKTSGARPYLAEYSPIPGTPMWEKAVALSTFNIEQEPLFHNNTFFACRRPDFTYDDLLCLKNMIRREKQKEI